MEGDKIEAPGPLVAVVVASYNPGELLRPAVQSLLCQTWRNLEIIVIDDGSTDCSIETLSDLEDPRLRIIRQENSGKPAALNRVLDQLSCDFYALNDADDLSHPRRIERQVECLLAHPELAGCFTGHELLIDGVRVAPRARAKSVEDCRRDIERMVMPAHDPTAMFRLSLLRDLRYAEDLPIAQGYDYILRAGERHPLCVIAECLYSYTILSQSVTRKDPLRRQRYIQEVLARARRRRGLPPGPSLPAGPPRRSHRNRFADNNLVAHFIESVVDLRQAGRLREALQTALYALRRHPLDPYYYRPLAYALSPVWLLRWRERRRRRRAG